MSLVTLSVDSDEKDVKENKDQEDFTPIQIHLRPFLVLLQCFALHYPENGQSLSHMKKIKAVHPMNSPKLESKCSGQFVYCLVILIIMSLNVFRYIPSFWVGFDFIPNLTTPRVINIVWFGQCFFNSVFMFKACTRFDIVISRLEKLLNEDGQKAIFKINEIRLKHLQITKAVEILDRDIRLFFTGVYLTGILICCFIVYNLINRKISGTFELVIYLYWLIMNKIIIISSSVLAAQVNEAVNFFVYKLNGPAVGFTMMSMVTVTKELLLMLAGLYISYLFLLMQFQL
ncbi:uncharacterized protein LOC134271818 [Saccostrea cucullata]|uniref:uncharacterized protein LOC134271818 n=1 Tax=Saccostrea cuccullata TaxID=36930 RepID=UPI002ED36AEE